MHVFFAAVAVAAGLGEVRFSVIDEGPTASGRPAPALTDIEELDGASVSLHLADGTPTLVNFWASWCGPCVAEMPDLVRFAKENAGKLNVVGLACDSPVNEVKRVIERKQVDYRVLMAGKRTQRAYGVGAFPTTLLVDGAGVIRWSREGMVDHQALQRALDGLAQPTSTLVGETVLARGAVVGAAGFVIAPRELLDAPSDLVAIVGDVPHNIIGVVAEAEDVLLLRVEGVAGPGSSEAVSVSVGEHASVVSAEAAAALIASVDPTKPPKPLGPDVTRNLIISCVFFACIAFAFFVPRLLRRLREKRPARHLRVVH